MIPADSSSGASLRHSHVFLGEDHDRNERRTWLVIAITATMMVVEIVAGRLTGSMALTADGWHMSTHAAALSISAFAYRFARRNARNPRFTFGTGKLGDLAGFTSAVVLALIALFIAWESFLRFTAPVPIDFSEAILVAAVGLVVNLVCALLLRGDHHHHGHQHGEAHDHHGHHDHHGNHAGHGDTDRNLRAAYLHVMADALTSVLAIAALLAGSLYGWLWLDPVIGVFGALLIARWATSLIRDAGVVLVDYVPPDEDLPEEIATIMRAERCEVTDLHVWRLGPGHHGAIVAVVTEKPRPPSYYREKLAAIHDLSHVTVEVEPQRA